MKTKFIKTSIIVTVAFILTVSNGNALFAQFGGGDGTVNNPYQIKTKKHLELLADSVISGNNWSKGKYFKVMNDITDSVSTIIGRIALYSHGDVYIETFQGDFNGNNKKITLAIVNLAAALNIIFPSALFGTTYQANIYNVIVDGYVNGRLSSIGGICGNAINSEISNCINYCNVYCDNIADTTLADFSGGICGSANFETNILNCVNYGNVVNGDMFIGGICGHTSDVKIINCKNYGNINGRACVGGICGHTETGNNISYCSNSGTITANNDGVGGIVGHFKGDTMSYCVNIGTIIGKKGIIDYRPAYVGGIVGMGGFEYGLEYYNSSLVYNCINSGLVIGINSTGGIIGRAYKEDKISNCINTGTVKGDTKTGCIVGENDGGTIENCHYDKQICSGEE